MCIDFAGADQCFMNTERATSSNVNKTIKNHSTCLTLVNKTKCKNTIGYKWSYMTTVTYLIEMTLLDIAPLNLHFSYWSYIQNICI